MLDANGTYRASFAPKFGGVSAPGGELSLEVEGADDCLVLELAPRLAGDGPQDLELVALGVLAVERLGDAVVGRADQRAQPAEGVRSCREVGDRVDLPGKVVEANSPLCGPRGVRAHA